MPLRRMSTLSMKLFIGSVYCSTLPRKPHSWKSTRLMTRHFSRFVEGSEISSRQRAAISSKPARHSPTSRCGVTVRARRSAPVSSS
jgi:hypothetical protein